MKLLDLLEQVTTFTDSDGIVDTERLFETLVENGNIDLDLIDDIEQVK